jgi:hypothetical protein
LPSVPGTDESRDDEPSPGDDEATEDPIEVDEDPVPPPRPAAPARRTSPVRRPPPPEYEPEPEPAFEEPAMEGDSPGEFEQDDSGSNYTESPPPRSGGGPGRARLVGGEE